MAVMVVMGMRVRFVPMVMVMSMGMILRVAVMIVVAMRHGGPAGKRRNVIMLQLRRKQGDWRNRPSSCMTISLDN